VVIGFQRSGGFAGITISTALDTSKLPAAEGREFEQLVEKLEASGVGDQAAPGKPDRFQYEVTVKRDGGTRCFRMAEHELTPEGSELVKRLTERAKKR
jgi:emfourin